MGGQISVLLFEFPRQLVPGMAVDASQWEPGMQLVHRVRHR